MAVIEAMIEITPTNIASSSVMRNLAIATTTLTATIDIDRNRIESRRSTACFSVHNPVRDAPDSRPTLPSKAAQIAFS
jgi:hypothetical protein